MHDRVTAATKLTEEEKRIALAVLDDQDSQ
jgi:hypothetical protein